jgi:hypothetical protein
MSNHSTRNPARRLAMLGASLAALALSGTLNFGSTSQGGSPHMSAELLKTLAQIDIVHVP